MSPGLVLWGGPLSLSPKFGTLISTHCHSCSPHSTPRLAVVWTHYHSFAEIAFREVTNDSSTEEANRNLLVPSYWLSQQQLTIGHKLLRFLPIVDPETRTWIQVVYFGNDLRKFKGKVEKGRDEKKMPTRGH